MLSSKQIFNTEKLPQQQVENKEFDISSIDLTVTDQEMLGLDSFNPPVTKEDIIQERLANIAVSNPTSAALILSSYRQQLLAGRHSANFLMVIAESNPLSASIILKDESLRKIMFGDNSGLGTILSGIASKHIDSTKLVLSDEFRPYLLKGDQKDCVDNLMYMIEKQPASADLIMALPDCRNLLLSGDRVDAGLRLAKIATASTVQAKEILQSDKYLPLLLSKDKRSRISMIADSHMDSAKIIFQSEILRSYLSDGFKYCDGYYITIAAKNSKNIAILCLKLPACSDQLTDDQLNEIKQYYNQPEVKINRRLRPRVGPMRGHGHFDTVLTYTDLPISEGSKEINTLCERLLNQRKYNRQASSPCHYYV